MLSTSLLAQPVSNAPASSPAAPVIQTPAPAPAVTNAPAAKKKSAPKTQAKKKPAAAELKTEPLVAGPAVVEANHVNVRGQAKLKSEVVTRLDKGQTVTVLEEIVHNNSGADEPSAWAKILLPTNTHVWVNTAYIDGTNKTVRPKRLNLRSGPGENYSVLGQLEHGDPVKEVTTKGDWTQIEPPANAYAFVAAQFLKQEAPGAVVASTPPEPVPPPIPPPTPATVPEGPAVATNATEVAVPAAAPGETNAAPLPPPPTEPPATPAADEPPPKRIVQREGLVRGLVSIQAPTKFSLVSPDNGRTIDYLYTTSPNLDLRRYKGLRIVVTGEEALDDRWGNTPVITIQKIQVVDESQ
jgi:uncharacterized protein YgiM (DUF1202 family)